MLKSTVVVLAFGFGCLIFAAAEPAAGTAGLERRVTGLGSVPLITDRIILNRIRQETRTYKNTPQCELKLHLFFPPGWEAADRRPTIVFFFGGGWRVGSASQFIPWAEYFASRGLVCVLPDYRIASIHHTKVNASLEDAKSAMRWVRTHASEIGVHADKIISSGGSAGGHLAAGVALVPGFDAPEDNGKISPTPNAMVLLDPALNLTLITKSDDRFTNTAGEPIADKLSPTLFLRNGTVPTIFFGTADALKSHGDEFLEKSKALGNRCEMWTAMDGEHGFFNFPPWLAATAIRADKFLASLSYLKGEATPPAG